MPSRAGSPNKQKQALIALLQQKYPGWQPVCDMAEAAIAMMDKARESGEMDEWIAASALCDRVAKYITPQLKAVDATVTQVEKLRIAWDDNGTDGRTDSNSVPGKAAAG